MKPYLSGKTRLNLSDLISISQWQTQLQASRGLKPPYLHASNGGPTYKLLRVHMSFQQLDRMAIAIHYRRSRWSVDQFRSWPRNCLLGVLCREGLKFPLCNWTTLCQTEGQPCKPSARQCRLHVAGILLVWEDVQCEWSCIYNDLHTSTNLL